MDREERRGKGSIAGGLIASCLCYSTFRDSGNHVSASVFGEWCGAVYWVAMALLAALDRMGRGL